MRRLLPLCVRHAASRASRASSTAAGCSSDGHHSSANGCWNLARDWTGAPAVRFSNETVPAGQPASRPRVCAVHPRSRRSAGRPETRPAPSPARKPLPSPCACGASSRPSSTLRNAVRPRGSRGSSISVSPHTPAPSGRRTRSAEQPPIQARGDDHHRARRPPAAEGADVGGMQAARTQPPIGAVAEQQRMLRRSCNAFQVSSSLQRPSSVCSASSRGVARPRCSCSSRRGACA